MSIIPVLTNMEKQDLIKLYFLLKEYLDNSNYAIQVPPEIDFLVESIREDIQKHDN